MQANADARSQASLQSHSGHRPQRCLGRRWIDRQRDRSREENPLLKRFSERSAFRPRRDGDLDALKPAGEVKSISTATRCRYRIDPNALRRSNTACWRAETLRGSLVWMDRYGSLFCILLQVATTGGLALLALPATRGTTRSLSPTRRLQYRKSGRCNPMHFRPSEAFFGTATTTGRPALFSGVTSASPTLTRIGHLFARSFRRSIR